MQLKKNKIIGIWGLGKTGKSIVTFLQSQGYKKLIAHAPTINNEQQQFLAQHNTDFIENQNSFLQQADIIIPSPGIKIQQFKKYKNKFVAELDLFCEFWQKPIIGITGSIGKTTVTHLLDQLLKKNDIAVCTGGNIGKPMLEMVQENAEFALLELSSFQLALAKTIQPSIAILTNFYPNHLDWHPSVEDYFAAKMYLFKNMDQQDKAIIPLELQDRFKNIQAELHIFSDKQIDPSQMHADASYYSLHNNAIIRSKNNIQSEIPFYYNEAKSFPINWLIISICLSLLQKKINPEACTGVQLFEHRLEKICTLNGVTIYNDSKSTVPQATLAAVQKLQSKRIHLLLGGLGKNIDREPLIKDLKNKVKVVYCFGKEAESLHQTCKKENITSYSFATLDEAVESCFSKAKPQEQILFSPAGSSFDLFENYEKRGEYFKKLVFKKITIE